MMIEYKNLFESLPGLYLVLSPELKILTASNAYLRATFTEREKIVNCQLFEVFPDNPNDPNATGVANLRASLSRVLKQKKTDVMPIQKYDVRLPGSSEGRFEERYWSPSNSPVLNEAGDVALIVHQVEDVTDFVRSRDQGKVAERLQADLFQRDHQIKNTERELKQVERKYQLIVESVKDYAIFMLDPQGHIVSWNPGAERTKGFRAGEVIGRHFSMFYPKESVASGKPEWQLKIAAEHGKYEEEDWRLHKDGSKKWMSVILTAVRNEAGTLIGFSKISRDLTEKRAQEEALKQKTVALAAINKELEAFSFSVSHDLRAPLRGIDGFSLALLEDYGSRLDEQAKLYLSYIRQGTQKMGKLIDDLLNLSRTSRLDLNLSIVDLTALAREIGGRLQSEQKRACQFIVQENMVAKGDSSLLAIAFENLIGNAFKFSEKSENMKIEVGSGQKGQKTVYFVRDHGAGFNMKYYDKLFGAFQRLHSDADFKGTGIGLATVKRIVSRHGGDIWAEGEIGHGATFWFTLD